MSHHSISDYVDFGPLAAYERVDLSEGELLREGGPRPELLSALAERAFRDIAFFLPKEQVEGFASVLSGEGSSEADRFVAASLIRNAAIAAEGSLPLCQDTGTALVYGWRGAGLRRLGDEEGALADGARAAWAACSLRSSQLGPRAGAEGPGERNTGDNSPPYADIRPVEGAEYRLCFAAKGGGSANRTSLSMEAPALLESSALDARLAKGIAALGAAGCPPYRISAVLGGSSPDQALYVLALAGLGLLDSLPESSPGDGRPLRDRSLEKRVMELAAETGIGAQFGGTRLALDARFVRLPRHAASLPLATGVSCSAHRRAKALIRSEGLFLEVLEKDPGRFLPPALPLLPGARALDLDRPTAEVAGELATLRAGAFLLVSGTVVVARDAAHARFARLIASGSPLPDYLLRHPVFYAGPTEARPGAVSGSFGPTTACRMDSYLEPLMARGASLVTIAKGGRSAEAAAAIARHGGSYLACVGGAAALAAREHVLSSEVIDYADLGMEAIRLVRLRELPALLVVDAEGGDFYARR